METPLPQRSRYSTVECSRNFEAHKTVVPAELVTNLLPRIFARSEGLKTLAHASPIQVPTWTCQIAYGMELDVQSARVVLRGDVFTPEK